MLADDARHENVPPPLNLTWTLNHTIKGMIEVNSWKKQEQPLPLEKLHSLIGQRRQNSFQ